MVRFKSNLCLAQISQYVHLLLSEREIATHLVPAKQATTCKAISGQHTTTRIELHTYETKLWSVLTQRRSSTSRRHSKLLAHVKRVLHRERDSRAYTTDSRVAGRVQHQFAQNRDDAIHRSDISSRQPLDSAVFKCSKSTE